MEYTFTEKNFQSEVLESDVPVLIDFYADWCGPCKMMMPVVAQLAQEFEGRMKVGRINSDAEPALARRFKVMSIPSFFIVKNGHVVDEMVGAMPKKRLAQRMEAQLV